jgi:hypothetical protein
MSASFDPYHKWLGIPPEEQPPNHYRLLGITLFERDRDVIQMAVDRQMMLLRTLRTGQNAKHSERILNEISVAKLCLLDAKKKVNYDAELREDLGIEGPPAEALSTVEPQQAEPQAAPKLPPRPGQTVDDDDSDDNSEPRVRVAVPPRPGQESAVDDDEDEDEHDDDEFAAVTPPPVQGDSADDDTEDSDESHAPVAVLASTTKKTSGGSPGGSARYSQQARRRKKQAAWVMPAALGAGAIVLLIVVGYVISNSSNKPEDPRTSRRDPGLAVERNTDSDSAIRTNPRPRPRPRPGSNNDDPSAQTTDTSMPKVGEFVPDGTDPGFRLPPPVDSDTTPVVGPDTEPKPEEVVHVDDLTEKDFAALTGATLGKHGTTGFPDGMPQQISFRGGSVEHALSMHPPSSGASHVVYQLDGNYLRFRATAALVDEPDNTYAQQPLTFKVLGDDRILWESPVKTAADAQPCDVSLAGVQILRLEIHCPGDSKNAWAAWIDPQLVMSQRPGAGPPPNEAVVGLSKLPIPDDAEQKRARAQITRLYRDAVTQAKTPELKLALSEKILGGAKQAADQAERFASIELAGRLAAQAGNVTTAFQTVDELAKSFKIDQVEMKTSLLGLASQNSSGKTQDLAVANRALQMIDEAIDDDDFEMAERLASIAVTASRKTRETEFIKQVVARNKEVDEIADQHSAAMAAMETLKTNSDDAEANQIAGRYFCLSKGDWPKGLPLLAKGTDDALKAMAAQDAAGAADANGRIVLGNGWWDLAQNEDGLARKQLELRAAQWYRLALVGLSGDVKADVEARLAGIEARYRMPEPGADPGAEDQKPDQPKKPDNVHPVLGYELKPHANDAMEFKKHYYKFVRGKITWREAQLRCQRMGGYLAVVGSQEEADFIAGQIRTTDRIQDAWLRMWLGLVRRANGWRWINGEPTRFNFFASSQPDNALGNEYCVQTGDDGRWQDAADDAGNNDGFICEWDF